MGGKCAYLTVSVGFFFSLKGGKLLSSDLTLRRANGGETLSHDMHYTTNFVYTHSCDLFFAILCIREFLGICSWSSISIREFYFRGVD